jgi:hypothetical protein
MKEFLPEGSVVCKLWIGEADKYRDHLLRFDPQNRRNRFSGRVSDQFIRNYDLTLSIRFLRARSARSNEISRHRSFVSSRGRA